MVLSLRQAPRADWNVRGGPRNETLRPSFSTPSFIRTAIIGGQSTLVAPFPVLSVETILKGKHQSLFPGLPSDEALQGPAVTFPSSIAYV